MLIFQPSLNGWGGASFQQKLTRIQDFPASVNPLALLSSENEKKGKNGMHILNQRNIHY